MKHHYAFFSIYNFFQAFVKTQHSIVIKCFRCDLDGKYIANAFRELLASHVTIHHTSCTNTLGQNDVAKRKHRCIVETDHYLLLSTCVPSEMLGKVVLIVVHLINKILSSHTSNLSPFERLYGYAPNYFSLRVFCCTSFVLSSSCRML